MSNIPEELRYTASHEWARKEADGTLTIGITYFAQDALGDIVFAELPEVGRVLGAGEEFGVVESVKAVSDVYAPVAGEVVAINEGLNSKPEVINEAPYTDGWLIRIQPADSGAFDAMLSAGDYAASLNK
jgi:glycine cleavage system H protein